MMRPMSVREADKLRAEMNLPDRFEDLTPEQIVRLKEISAAVNKYGEFCRALAPPAEVAEAMLDDEELYRQHVAKIEAAVNHYMQTGEMPPRRDREEEEA